MTLTNFLVFDALLIFLAILAFVIFKPDKLSSTIFLDSFDNKKLEASLLDIPSLAKLLELEKLSKSNGSNVSFDSLGGSWRFLSVWKSKNNSNDPIANYFLRLFSACLKLEPMKLGEAKQSSFKISNSIEFGILSIRFSGLGDLQGKQPLLSFYFENIDLLLGSKLLFRKTLSEPSSKNRPFFAFIGIEKDSCWLSARGRGGGLALWVKDKEFKK
tara:strand:- start:1598 stop:2242 length:645 start_codon:yes stop_codon:yes gene_type:complete